MNGAKPRTQTTKTDKRLQLHDDIRDFNDSQPEGYRELCRLLAQLIVEHLPEAENKLWHRHPVWFIDDNPIVGYSKQKPGIRLMFWSGAGFDEPDLNVRGKKFKDASIFFNTLDEIDREALKRWLEKSRAIQWDYKNLIRRKGDLVRLK